MYYKLHTSTGKLSKGTDSFQSDFLLVQIIYTDFFWIRLEAKTIWCLSEVDQRTSLVGGPLWEHTVRLLDMIFIDLMYWMMLTTVIQLKSWQFLISQLSVIIAQYVIQTVNVLDRFQYLCGFKFKNTLEACDRTDAQVFAIKTLCEISLARRERLTWRLTWRVTWGESNTRGGLVERNIKREREREIECHKHVDGLQSEDSQADDSERIMHVQWILALNSKGGLRGKSFGFFE